MKKLTNIVARLLDYFWFYSISAFFLDILDADLYLYIAALALTPLFFIPIEALLLKFFRTTLGKILFGLRYNAAPSWKEALSRSWRKEHLIQKRPKIFPYTLLIACATALSAFSAFSEVSDKLLPGNVRLCCKGKGTVATDKWSKLTPQNNRFSALFPKEPEFNEKQFPANSRTLQYKEYTTTDGLITYSIGHMDLPRSWTKWGAKRVFQGCYQIVAKQFSVQYKQRAPHDAFPAYEYEMSDAGTKYVGKLVLVNDTLYRVEVSKAGTITEEEMASAEMFFSSFHPQK